MEEKRLKTSVVLDGGCSSGKGGEVGGVGIEGGSVACRRELCDLPDVLLVGVFLQGNRRLVGLGVSKRVRGLLLEYVDSILFSALRGSLGVEEEVVDFDCVGFERSLKQFPHPRLSISLNFSSNPVYGGRVFSHAFGFNFLNRVRVLDVSGVLLGGEGGISLGSLFASSSGVLEEFCGAGCELGARGMVSVAKGLVHHLGLRRVNVRGNHFGNGGLKAVSAMLLRTRCVTHLDCGGNKIVGHVGVNCLCIAMNRMERSFRAGGVRCGLEELLLGENSVKDAGASCLAGLVRLGCGGGQLRVLGLEWNFISSIGFVALCKAFAHRVRSLSSSCSIFGLEELRFRENLLSSSGASTFADYLLVCGAVGVGGGLRGLKAIEIGWNNLGDAGGMELARGLDGLGVNGSFLEVLDVRANFLSGRSGDAILRSVVSRSWNLSKLLLSGNHFGPGGGENGGVGVGVGGGGERFEWLARGLSGLRRLRVLEIGWIGLGSDGLELISGRISGGDGGGVEGGDGAGEGATGLCACAGTLEELNLCGNQLRGVSMTGAFRLEFLRACSRSGGGGCLRVLDLSSNDLGVDGGVGLGEGLLNVGGIDSLSRLELSWNQLGLAGARGVTSALSTTCPRLSLLNLSWNDLRCGDLETLGGVLKVSEARKRCGVGLRLVADGVNKDDWGATVECACECECECNGVCGGGCGKGLELDES